MWVCCTVLSLIVSVKGILWKTENHTRYKYSHNLMSLCYNLSNLIIFMIKFTMDLTDNRFIEDLIKHFTVTKAHTTLIYHIFKSSRPL